MQGNNYEHLTTLELRELFLNGTLDSDLMSKNDYEKLFGYEMELDTPSEEILFFCSNGLNQFSEYRKDTHQMPSYEEFIEKSKKSKNNKKKNMWIRFARQAAMIALIATAALVLAQGVSMALGYNLFGYIYNWFRDKETVIITTDNVNEDDSYDLPQPKITAVHGETAEEFVFIEYKKIDDIDNVWLNRVSKRLIEEYDFLEANYDKWQDDEKLTSVFKDSENNILILTIQNSPVFHVEKEINGIVEDIIFNGVTFTTFRNMEDYNVVWEYEGYAYQLNAHLPLEEVEAIIREYY